MAGWRSNIAPQVHVSSGDAEEKDSQSPPDRKHVDGILIIFRSGMIEDDVARAVVTYIKRDRNMILDVAQVKVCGAQGQSAWHCGSWPGNPNPDIRLNATIDMYYADGNFITTNHVYQDGYGTRQQRHVYQHPPTPGYSRPGYGYTRGQYQGPSRLHTGVQAGNAYGAPNRTAYGSTTRGGYPPTTQGGQWQQPQHGQPNRAAYRFTARHSQQSMISGGQRSQLQPGIPNRNVYRSTSRAVPNHQFPAFVRFTRDGATQQSEVQVQPQHAAPQLQNLQSTALAQSQMAPTAQTQPLSYAQAAQGVQHQTPSPLTKVWAHSMLPGKKFPTNFHNVNCNTQSTDVDDLKLRKHTFMSTTKPSFGH